MEEKATEKEGGVDKDARNEITRLAFKMEEMHWEFVLYKQQSDVHGTRSNMEVDTLESQSEVQALKIDIGKLKDELEIVRRENISIRSQLNTDTITIHGFNFQAPESYLQFVRNHTKDGDWAFCYDFVSIFGDTPRSESIVGCIAPG